jgi:hypothetical protein
MLFLKEVLVGASVYRYLLRLLQLLVLHMSGRSYFYAENY